MKINILGQTALKKLMIEEPKKHEVVYYTNSDQQPVQEVIDNAISSLHIPADDIDHYKFKHYNPPTAKNIKDVLDWTKDKDALIVACHAGVSRSASTAYVIAARKLGAKKALDILEKGFHWPNRLVVYMGSKLLNDDTIWTEFVEWQQIYNGTDPSQNNAWPTSEVKSQIYWP